MRSALLSWTVLLIACGASPSPARRVRVARAPQLEPRTRFDIERIAEERLDGALRATRHERVYLSIGARQPDGGYAARALLVVVQGQDRIGRILYDVRLAPDLTLRGDPIERCEDLPDELAPERVLRHVLGAVPRARTRGEYEGEHWSDLREEPLAARAEARRARDRVRVRAEAQLALEDDAIAGVLATGSARVRVIAELDRTWLVGEVRSRIESRATVRDPGGRGDPVPGRIRIDETITTTRTTGDVPSDQSCGPSGGFDVRQVTGAIRTRQAAIRACYERELRRNPDLRGSVRVTLTIQESGDVTGVAVTESTLGAAVDECLVHVIQGFRFRPGPEGGSVTYAFPFVFEPQR